MFFFNFGINWFCFFSSLNITDKLLEKYSNSFLDKSSLESNLNLVKSSFSLIKIDSTHVFSLVSALAHLNCCQFEVHYDDPLRFDSQSMEHLENAEKLLKIETMQ